MALIVWIAIYPTITVLLALGGGLIAPWPLPLRTLALTAVAVPLMVFIARLIGDDSADAAAEGDGSGCGHGAQPTQPR